MTREDLISLKETAALAALTYDEAIAKVGDDLIWHEAVNAMAAAGPALVEEALVQGQRVAEMWTASDNIDERSAAIIDDLKSQLAAAHKRADHESRRADRHFQIACDDSKELEKKDAELARAHAKNKKVRAQLGDLYLKNLEMNKRIAEAARDGLRTGQISVNVARKMFDIGALTENEYQQAVRLCGPKVERDDLGHSLTYRCKVYAYHVGGAIFCYRYGLNVHAHVRFHPTEDIDALIACLLMANNDLADEKLLGPADCCGEFPECVCNLPKKDDGSVDMDRLGEGFGAVNAPLEETPPTLDLRIRGGEIVTASNERLQSDGPAVRTGRSTSK